MHRPPLPLAAAAALVALSTVASSTSLDHPRSGFLQDVLESKGAGQNYCKVLPRPPCPCFTRPSPAKLTHSSLRHPRVAPRRCQPTGQIHDACCDYETVESVNEDLFGRLHELVATPYFRYHKVRRPRPRGGIFLRGVR